MAKYRVTKGKSFDENGDLIKIGHVFEAEEVPAFLVGKVEEVVADDVADADADAKAAADAKAKAAADAAKK